MAKILEDLTQQQPATEPVAEDDFALIDETKAETFKRLAIKRTTNALDKIRLIGNLSSANYEYTAEQVEKICDTLRDAIDNVEKKFAKTKEKAKFEF